MSHNWSATKQRLHPQSVAEISRHSVLSGDRIRQCETAETTVVDGGRNLVAGLWGHTLGENWPPEPTSSYASIDFWCQLVANTARTAFWMWVVILLIMYHHFRLFLNVWFAQVRTVAVVNLDAVWQHCCCCCCCGSVWRQLNDQYVSLLMAYIAPSPSVAQSSSPLPDWSVRGRLTQIRSTIYPGVFATSSSAGRPSRRVPRSVQSTPDTMPLSIITGSILSVSCD